MPKKYHFGTFKTIPYNQHYFYQKMHTGYFHYQTRKILFMPKCQTNPLKINENLGFVNGKKGLRTMVEQKVLCISIKLL